MIKTQYQKELLLSAPKAGRSMANKKTDVVKIQSWLCLYGISNPSSGTATAVDGDFGPSTERAVMNYQRAMKVNADGIVDAALFALLCQPMNTAFTKVAQGSKLRDIIVAVANLHAKCKPYELTINGQSNSGPWVRAYMDGNEGEPWFWCMGFVQSILDQAASQSGKKFTDLMPLSYSCDTVATVGIHKNLLVRSAALRSDPSLVKPGDIFLVRKSQNDWIHTGIITAIHDEVFETIEGNTNTDGSNNGNGVYKRTRNFRQSVLDVFSIEPLV